MPFDHGLRLNNRQRIATAREKPIKANKNQAVDGSEGLFLRSGSPQNVYLLPQHPNFHLKRCPRPKQICDHPNKEPDKISHPAPASPDSRSTASQIEFAIGTGDRPGLHQAGVYLGSIVTTLLWIQALRGAGEASAGFIFAIAFWLWFTVLFANAAEALAEGRGKAQAEALRATRQRVSAKVLAEPKFGSASRLVASDQLTAGTLVLVEAGDTIPADGEVIQGVASVDESAITGESAPVIRESGGDFSSVTGGTRVLSDCIIVRVTANPGEAFLDRMIAMVEGAKRNKTPNEVALTILLVALTIIFLLVCATLLPFSSFSVVLNGSGQLVTLTVLIALLVCLIPTTIGALLSAIGIAGMSRMMKANVLASSGRAIEAAGDVDVLLLDKTGTITLGNREATVFVPAPGVDERTLADATQLASLSDETPEGRSIVVLAKKRFNFRVRELQNSVPVPFSARTRMSGLDIGERHVRKGAASAIRAYVEGLGGVFPAEVTKLVDDISGRGSTPLVVADGGRVLGAVELKDIVKGGIKERFAALRKMGIKTVMITGDNHLTAAAIAAEAGVDDYLAEATPEDKLRLIREYQVEGRLVAMTGDGTNDAPALAQADVAVAMNSGTQAGVECRSIGFLLQMGVDNARNRGKALTGRFMAHL
jgi:potassium-transporting ATPase ATP-binding subunit